MSRFLSYRRNTRAARSPPTFFHVRTHFDRYSFLFICVYIPFSPAFTALSSFTTNAYPGLRTANFFQLGGGAGPRRVGSTIAHSTLTPRSSPASSPRAKEPQERDPRSGDTTCDTRSYRARSRTPRPLTPYRPSTRIRNLRRAELDASTPRSKKTTGLGSAANTSTSRRAPDPEQQQPGARGVDVAMHSSHRTPDASLSIAQTWQTGCVCARVIQSTRAVTRSQADYSPSQRSDPESQTKQRRQVESTASQAQEQGIQRALFGHSGATMYPKTLASDTRRLRITI